MAAPTAFTDDVRVSRYTSFIRHAKAVYFMLGLAVLLLVLAVAVHIFGVFEFDIAVTHFVQAIRSNGVDRFAELVTHLGNAGAIIAVAVLAALYFYRIGLPKSAALSLISIISYPLNVGIKDVVDRVRPTSSLVKIVSPAGGYSFPSGHAMITMTVYGCIAYLLWTHIKSTYRWTIPTIAGLVIILVGLSRIYLGVHWFSDVFGGWIAGTVLILILAELHNKWERKAV